MKINYVNVPYLVTPVKEHFFIKSQILKLIEDEHCFSSFSGISKTDWHLPKDQIRQYMNFAYRFLEDSLIEIHKTLGVPNFRMQNFWFQQYEQTSYHSWHVHFETTFVNVYYVELPDPSVATQFKNPITQEIITPEVEEGVILTFPGSIIHGSPENNSGARKTIIGLNTVAHVD